MAKPNARRPRAAASYSRFSTAMQQADSITDQQRKCREQAALLGLAVDPALEFADQAVSGTKLARKGLDALLYAARGGRFGTLLVESLSRLARESVITMPLMKELVEVRGIRVVSAGEGIDTDRPGWELLASFMSLQHERYVKDLATTVLRGQEGAVLAGHSVGDWCFGYSSEPVPGSEAGRRGRHPKPRMRYVVDPDAAPWVRQIFEWFAYDKQSMRWIARELTRGNAPKDHRATTEPWHPSYVRRVLTNPKYTGLWPWGRRSNRRNPFDGRVRQEERPAAESQKWLREMPELRIIDDALWDAAQARLAELAARCRRRKPDGRLDGAAPGHDHASPRHLLAGLLRCEGCGSPFQVGGTKGIYMSCRGHTTGVCDRETMVPRRRAEEMIVAAVAGRVLACPAWHAEVLAALEAESRRLEAQTPDLIRQARKDLADVEQKVRRLLDAVEEGDAPDDLRDRLAGRRAEAEELRRRVDVLKKAEDARPPAPTAAWVAGQFRALKSLLAEGGPAAALALRALVGGRVDVLKVERPGRKRHGARLRFTVAAPDLLARFPGAPPADTDATPSRAAEVVLDLREPAPWELIVDEVMGLWDQGLLMREIAERLGCSGNQVRKAVDRWHEQRGLEPPDGRSRRRQLPPGPAPQPPDPAAPTAAQPPLTGPAVPA